jgi:hypothetical protein
VDHCMPSKYPEVSTSAFPSALTQPQSTLAASELGFHN